MACFCGADARADNAEPMRRPASGEGVNDASGCQDDDLSQGIRPASMIDDRQARPSSRSNGMPLNPYDAPAIRPATAPVVNAAVAAAVAAAKMPSIATPAASDPSSKPTAASLWLTGSRIRAARSATGAPDAAARSGPGGTARLRAGDGFQNPAADRARHRRRCGRVEHHEPARLRQIRHQLTDGAVLRPPSAGDERGGAAAGHLSRRSRSSTSGRTCDSRSSSVRTKSRVATPSGTAARVTVRVAVAVPSSSTKAWMERSVQPGGGMKS